MSALIAACAISACDGEIGGAGGSSPQGGMGGIGGAGGDGGSAGDLLAGEDCDPIVPTICGMPFPSDVWTRADPDSPTGKRIAFGETTLPRHGSKGHLDAAAFAEMDGWAVGQAPMTHLPGATVVGLPSLTHIGLSLSKESPTVLIEADTGVAVPHFAELDMTGRSDGDRAFMLRPVVRLKDATRYIVAIRRVIDADGVPLPPSDVFAALRDGTPHDDPTVAPRRALYQDILGRLRQYNYDTRDLQLAWDFTTSSVDNKTRWMVSMRDKALEAVGDAGPEYTITSVEEDPNPHIRRRIEGEMTVPLFLTTAEPGEGMIHLGDDGLPEQNGTATFPFIVQIPHAATTGTPGAILQNGHGQLGSRYEGRNGYLAEIANRHNFVTIAVDYVGFAEADEEPLTAALVSDFLKLDRIFFQRQHQGMINQLLAMRMMKGRFWMDPQVQFDGQSAIDPSRCYYRGDSQGGINGATYLALSTDVTRGLLGEPGASYNFILNRSANFPPFFSVLYATFQSYINVQMALGAASMFWERVDPITYLPHITDDPFPDTPVHHALLHVAVGDHQVSEWTAHLMARGLNAVHVTPSWRHVWGLDHMAAPFSGRNAMVEFKFPGVPPGPLLNIPTSEPEENDPHDWVRVLAASMDQTDAFLRTGQVVQSCAGICDPE